jgi:hypothetical protein
MTSHLLSDVELHVSEHVTQLLQLLQVQTLEDVYTPQCLGNLIVDVTSTIEIKCSTQQNTAFI